MNDSDPFNMVSGTTGLTGAVDGSLVLIKDKRNTNKVRLYATGRDIEYKELSLEFDKKQFVWNLVDCVDGNDDLNCIAKENPVVVAVAKLIAAQGDWSGTASELLKKLHEYSTELSIQPNSLTKALNQNREDLLQVGVKYDYKRTSQKKIITLTKVNDGSDANDGDFKVYPGT